MPAQLPHKLRPCGCNKTECWAFQCPKVFNAFPNAALTITLDSLGNELSIATKRKDPARPWRCPKPLYLLPPSLADRYYGYDSEHEVCRNKRQVAKKNPSALLLRAREKSYQRPSESPLRQATMTSDGNQLEDCDEADEHDRSSEISDLSELSVDSKSTDQEREETPPSSPESRGHKPGSIDVPPNEWPLPSLDAVHPNHFLQATATISCAVASLENNDHRTDSHDGLQPQGHQSLTT